MTQCTIRHFSIPCDDLDRAVAFYQAVFGWRAEPWGPPGFFLLEAGTDPLSPPHGDLHRRREPEAGVLASGFECTIGVPSLKDVIAAIEAHGGRIVMPRVRIEGVGDLIHFEDPEGNRAAAMQYDAVAAAPGDPLSRS